MSDQKVGSENSVQQDTPQVEESSSVDYKALYISEVENAKKQRKRAQMAEEENSSLKTTIDTDKEKRMRKNEEYKELSEMQSKKLEQQQGIVDKWNQYQESKREALMSKVDKKDRAQLEGLELDKLEFFVDKMSQSKPENPKVIANAVKANDMPDNIFALPSSERKARWDDYIKQFKK